MTSQHTPSNWRRQATYFISGQFLSLFGSMIVQHAITWHVTLVSQSGQLLTVFTCAALLPMVLISPLAGVWADTFSKKHLIIYSDGLIAVVTLMIACLYFMGIQSIWLLLIAVIIRSLGQGIQQPAVGSLIPELVPKSALEQFNGIQSATQSLTMFAAPMVSGALLTFLPIQYVFLIDIVTAIIGIGLVFICVHVTPRQPTSQEENKSYFYEMRLGLQYINQTSWLKILFISFACLTLLCAPISLLSPLLVTRLFGEEVWRLACLEILFALGMIIGSIISSIWQGMKRQQGHILIFTWLIIGTLTCLLAFVTHFGLFLVIFFLCGMTIPFYNITAVTLLQSHTPENMMGRIYSLVSMIGGLASPIGMLIFGPLSDQIAIKWLLVFTGCLLVLGSYWQYLFQKLPE